MLKLQIQAQIQYLTTLPTLLFFLSQKRNYYKRYFSATYSIDILNSYCLREIYNSQTLTSPPSLRTSFSLDGNSAFTKENPWKSFWFMFAMKDLSQGVKRAASSVNSGSKLSKDRLDFWRQRNKQHFSFREISTVTPQAPSWGLTSRNQKSIACWRQLGN